MSILVTGGAGYIGSIVSKVLIENGLSIVVLDDLSKSSGNAVPKEAKFYKGSIDDTQLLDKILGENSIDALMHFAAFIEVGESVVEPFKYFENNFYRTIKHINHLKSNGVKNIVFSSTAAVYGEPNYTPIDEEHLKNPTNPYGASKYFTEQFLDSLKISDDVNHIALRYFNASGAYKNIGEEHEPETHLIPLVLQTALGTRDKIYVNGNDYDTFDGTCVRDYIHVYDIATAHLLAYRYLIKNKKSEKINLGSSKGYSIMQIIDSCKKVTGVDIRYEIRSRRAGDPSTLIASSKKAETILGWQIKYDKLEDIISSAYEFHRGKK